MKISKARALEIYSTIYPEDGVREVPAEHNERRRRDDIAAEVQAICAAPTPDKAAEVIARWNSVIADGEERADLRRAVRRMRAMGRAKR